MSIAVKSGLPSLGSTEGAVITKDDISVTEETSPSASAGEDLPRGKSAYEVAVENGFSGTETEWLASLKGATGAPGADGKNGENGKTPYVGDNGNWYIGADDTGKPSRGAKGDKGDTGAQGIQGEQGIQGVQGEKGDKGEKGAQGPQGLQGPQGAAGADGKTPYVGDNGNWFVGSDDTGKPSRGARGEPGSPGAKGDKGDPGATPNLTIGSVTTLDAGQNATASMGGTAENPVLNLGIPKGADGQPGTDGKTAYQYAQDGGYTGTETEFAAKLAQEIPEALPNPNALTFTGAVNTTYDGSTAVSVEIPSGGGADISLGLTSASVGQIIKVKAIDASGKPTAWEAANMPSGGGHWETVLDTVWEQDVIHPTAFNSETGIFTCAEGELNNLELNKEYIFYQQCAVKDVEYITILNADATKVTKLSDTTFSINVPPSEKFTPTNIKFSRGVCLAVTDIDAKKIRLTLDGQFHATASLYDFPFFGAGKPYFAVNAGSAPILNAYQAYQQVTAEVESPYRIVGEILCGFNAPSSSYGAFHFKNNSFCCPLVPYDVPEGDTRTYFLTSDGTKIAKLYSTKYPSFLGGAYNNTAIDSDYLKIISGTKVKLERWVE